MSEGFFQNDSLVIGRAIWPTCYYCGQMKEGWQHGKGIWVDFLTNKTMDGNWDTGKFLKVNKVKK
jgi:hypothetical protein